MVGEDVEMDCCDESKYHVKAYGDDGKLVGKNQIVTIKLNGEIYRIKTDSNGVATFTIPNTLMPGTYTLEATYSGQTIKNTIKVRQIDKNENVEDEKSSEQIIYEPSFKTTPVNRVSNYNGDSFKFNGKVYKVISNTEIF